MVQVFDPTGERTMTLSEAVTRRDLRLDEVGFYEIRASGGTELVAVNPDPRESNLRRIEPETLDLWSNTGAAEAAEGGGEAALAATPPLRLWRWLLVFLIAIALLESLVGNSHLNVRREA